jgi:curved DNA-binding protein CbpA
MDANDDPYEILGLSRDASDADIKKAYRKLALKNHPDKQPTPEEREKANAIFAKISNAYQILTDSELRKKYEYQKKRDDFTTQSPRRSRTRHYTVPREESSGMDAPFSPSFTSSKTTMKNDGTKSTFQSTTTNEDGSTISFSFSSDKFNPDFEDPFEMFRKMYQEEYGKDFESTGPVSFSPSSKTRIVQHKGTFASPTSSKSKLSAPPCPRSSTKSPARSSITPKSVSRKKSSPLTIPIPLVDEETPYVSMSSSTKQIQHSDGRVETITEITKTFADGTVSTQRKSSTSAATTGSYKTTSSSPIRMSPRQVPIAIKTLGGSS